MYINKPDLPKEGPVAEALEQFSVHNMMLGAEILRDAAHHAVTKAARQRGWPCETQEQTHAAIERLDSHDELHLMASYLHAEGMPIKSDTAMARLLKGKSTWIAGRSAYFWAVWKDCSTLDNANQWTRANVVGAP